MSEEIMRVLGRIEGQLGGLTSNVEAQGKKLDGIDTRLRSVEQRSARSGAITGGAAAVGVTLIVEGIKHKLGVGGS